MSLQDHLDKFEKIKSQISQAGGNVENDTLVFVLLELIHARNARDVRSITRFVKPLTYTQVFDELLEMHKFSSINQQPDSNTEEANLSSAKNKKP